MITANSDGAAPPIAFDLPFHVSARADYAVRALTEVAASGRPISAQRISSAQAIPLRFLQNILADLSRAGLVGGRRGPTAGYELTRPPQDITVEETIRAVAGRLSSVHGTSLERIAYPGPAALLRDVWLAVGSSISAVLTSVTIADLAKGSLPPAVQELAGWPHTRVQDAFGKGAGPGNVADGV